MKTKKLTKQDIINRETKMGVIPLKRGQRIKVVDKHNWYYGEQGFITSYRGFNLYNITLELDTSVWKVSRLKTDLARRQFEVLR